MTPFLNVTKGNNTLITNVTLITQNLNDDSSQANNNKFNITMQNAG